MSLLMLATVGVTCHCLEKNPQEKILYSMLLSPPSTSAFCIASAKTVYNVTCLREEIVWRPDFIIIN